ncbi:MAG: PD40 domain-containing protein [candidate division Zixibacteria bacterium]|nr:PD40 domain-containing protein [candidate division Zixibacteria bacterium]
MRRLIGYALLTAAFLLTYMVSSGYAQYLNYFGHNKVQYAQFDWQIMQTEHIDLYYFPEEKTLAERAAASAERSYRALESQFSLSIHRRIPLILYSTHQFFEETNTIPGLLPESVGAFTEFLKGRVVMPNLGSYHEFDKVLRHELIHVFTIEKIKSVLTNHRLPPRVGPPLWFMEGIAEHWSEGWSSEADLFIRDAVLSGYLVPIPKINRIYGSFLMYKEGQSFLKFLEEKYGDETIELLFENWWRGRSFEEIVELSVGKSLTALSEEWVYTLQKQYFPVLEKTDMPSKTAKQLTRRGLNIKPVAVPADSGQSENMVFISTRNGYEDICLAPLEGTEQQVKLLVRGGRSSRFESFHFLRTRMSVNRDRQLVFVSQSGSSDVLNTLDIDTGKHRHRFAFPNIVGMSSPAWSPDGQKIVFSGLSQAGYSDLYVVDIKDGSLVKLTNDLYEDNEPTWSPDGQKIVFSSDRTTDGDRKGWHNLYALALETGEIEWITYGPYNDRSPAWSPDGRYIAFVSDRQTGLDLFLVDMGRQIYPLTRFATGALDVSWTPNNGSLLITGFEGFQFQTFRVSIPDSLRTEHAPVSDKRAALWIPAKIEAKHGSNVVPYKNRYSLDLAQGGFIAIPQSSDVTFGGGALFTFSDMLGNHHYNLLVSNTTETTGDFLKSFNVFVSRINLSRRMNYGFGLFHLKGRFFDDRFGLFDERRVGGVFLFNYPFSRFSRLEGNIGFIHSERDRILLTNRSHRAELITNYLAYVRDTVLWGPTGPIDGEGYQVGITHLTDLRRGDAYTTTMLADYRRYFRVANRLTFATRALGIGSFGREPQFLRFGGSWDFRGYPFRSLRGNRMVLINQEFRFPLMDVLSLGFPFGAMQFSRIQGALFVDAGNVWFDDDFGDVIGSFGGGVRVGLGGPLVLRFDFSRRVDQNFRRLQPGLKFTFWFGPDF